MVPEGISYTGPIQFESNVELHLERGALVLFSENLADYPVVASDWEGLTTHRAMSPLSARDKHDIAITGDGTFNGNGQKWRPVKKGKMTDNQWKELTKAGCINAKGDVWFPNERIREVYDNKELQAKGTPRFEGDRRVCPRFSPPRSSLVYQVQERVAERRHI